MIFISHLVIYISHDAILQASKTDYMTSLMPRPAAPKIDKRTPTVVGTDEKLVKAADFEFRHHGFTGTDSNKIARRAGFAPQTFYRWFNSKTEVFLAVYLAWENEERHALNALVDNKASAKRMAEAIIAHHRDYLIFRRSLRQLSLEDPEVRAARAQSRLRQISQIEEWAGSTALPRAQLATTLLQIERLADAVAEGEFSDLGLAEAAAITALAGLINHLRNQ